MVKWNRKVRKDKEKDHRERSQPLKVLNSK